ncbi:MAG: trehalose-phosphatase, partial [Candidatus Zixiibacteriota bacterium]
MKTFKTLTNAETFFKELANAPHRVLMLDYDGTLAPYVTERGRAIPYPGVRKRLNTLMASDQTRLIIVSGRTIEDLKPLLETKRLPEIWGSHGAEHLKENGEYELVPVNEIAVRGLVAADEWSVKEGLESCHEKKPTSLAFHWRGLDRDRADSIRNKVLNRWAEAVRQYGLFVHEFDGGLEIRVQGVDKGAAVKKVLEQLEPHTAVAYLGDDAT